MSWKWRLTVLPPAVSTPQFLKPLQLWLSADVAKPHFSKFDFHFGLFKRLLDIISLYSKFSRFPRHNCSVVCIKFHIKTKKEFESGWVFTKKEKWNTLLSFVSTVFRLLPRAWRTILKLSNFLCKTCSLHLSYLLVEIFAWLKKPLSLFKTSLCELGSI